MAEELAGALARIPGLRVISRTSVFALKDKGLDARQIADRLGAEFLVEGSVRKIGNRIRLNARLVSAADGCDLWSDSYQRTMEHVFSHCRGRCHGDHGRASPGPTRLRPIPIRRPTVPAVDAYTLYLRGRYSANKRTVEGLALALEYFEQAVEKDPGFALAHAGRAKYWGPRFPNFGDLSCPARRCGRPRLPHVEAVKPRTWLP